MPTLKEKLMAAKAEESVRLASVRNYSGVEEATPLNEKETVAVKPVSKVVKPKVVKPKATKPKTEKKVSSKTKKS